MRSTGLALAVVVLFSGVAMGQESYTVNATAGQVTDLTAIVDISNEQVCRGLGLALTCTQAQACTAKGAPGGASCTAVQARGAGVRIYPQTLAGREEFVTFALVASAVHREARQRTGVEPASGVPEVADGQHHGAKRVLRGGRAAGRLHNVPEYLLLS